MKVWYMRSNHSFAPIPIKDGVDACIAALKKEFDTGETYGMLCAKDKRLSNVVHAGSRDEWFIFEEAARKWLGKAYGLIPPKKEKDILTWDERARRHPDHIGIVTSEMLMQRMNEEIEELREALKKHEDCHY